MKTRSRNSDSIIPVATIIRGTDSSWTLGWDDLYRHRDLLYFLTWRDIKVRYKQTVLGITWAVLQPLAIAISLTLFLSRMVKLSPIDLPYPVFAYSGMVIWQFFAQSLIGAGQSLIENERLVSKVYFPRLLVPLSSVLASLFDFVISLFILAAFLIYFQTSPGAVLIFFPAVVFLTVLTASGMGFWLSALNVKYRDVRYTISFLVQFWFFATPIAYPSSAVPVRWRIVYELNPMVGIVEGLRWTLQSPAVFPARSLALSAGVTLVILISGLYYFRRTEDTFADYI
jgi:lipopolysaccharide transport system permease protein